MLGGCLASGFVIDAPGTATGGPISLFPPRWPDRCPIEGRHSRPLVKPVGPQVQETRKVGTDSSGRRARRQFAWRFAALGVLSVLAVAPGRAADTVYTIANYPVEASAENAVAAKDRAIGDGQQAAFRSL